MQFLLASLDATIDAQVEGALSNALDRLAGENFDLVLLDYAMPDTSGIEAMKQVHALHPQLPVAFLSGLDDPRLVAGALDMGAAGWLSKAMGGQAIVHALHLLLAGERFVPANLLLREAPFPLTPREQDVAALLAQGLADKQIAEALDLQLGTVKVHVKNILRKSGTENRTKFALLYSGS